MNRLPGPVNRRNWPQAQPITAPALWPAERQRQSTRPIARTSAFGDVPRGMNVTRDVAELGTQDIDPEVLPYALGQENSE